MGYLRHGDRPRRFRGDGGTDKNYLFDALIATRFGKTHRLRFHHLNLLSDLLNTEHFWRAKEVFGEGIP